MNTLQAPPPPSFRVRYRVAQKDYLRALTQCRNLRPQVRNLRRYLPQLRETTRQEMPPKNLMVHADARAHAQRLRTTLENAEKALVDAVCHLQYANQRRREVLAAMKAITR